MPSIGGSFCMFRYSGVGVPSPGFTELDCAIAIPVAHNRRGSSGSFIRLSPFNWESDPRSRAGETRGLFAEDCFIGIANVKLLKATLVDIAECSSSPALAETSRAVHTIPKPSLQ